MFTVTRRFSFCSAHSLDGHEGLCAHVHGHNYVAHVTVAADVLDDVGRVIDFSQLKATVGKWIDENWDHAFLHASKTSVNFERHYCIPKNPTAENMAEHLFNRCKDALPKERGLRCVSVTIDETENSSATYTP